MRVNVAHTNPPSTLWHLQSASEVFDRIVLCCRVRRSDSAIFGANLKLRRSQSCGYMKPALHALRRSCSACYEGSNGRELAKQREELAQELNVSIRETAAEFDVVDENFFRNYAAATPFGISQGDLLEPSLLGIRPEPPDWPARDEVIRDGIARRANSTELPFSLRMLKKKQRLKEGGCKSEESRESDLSSTNKGFASTVFIIRELQSHALHMRGIALNEDMDSIIDKVRTEMNSCFVWLFREVFSRTPDLMVNVMVLMANYAVISMEDPTPIEVSIPPPSSPFASKINGNIVSTTTTGSENQQQASMTVGVEPIGRLSQTIPFPKFVPEESLPEVPLFETGEGVQGGEAVLWNLIVDEASTMQWKDEGLDHWTMQQFVSPVTVDIEADDYVEYHRTDLHYQIGVSQEPDNPLLLSNYAQFLYTVAHDYERAEECFQRAIQLDPADAETQSQYATFLWLVRKDLWGAEERYQQAMAAEPENPYHASKYASFLWSTGGDDTCYPLDVSHTKK
ncbi:hypothetical protein Ancab_034448 [Ancistrocladus abbreviatus]